MTSKEAWEGDLLDYKSIGHAFTNLIKSIDEAKVISIEAGFGRGKTFFRKAWSEQLREAGEIVIEIDVQQSDHSGDPVITLLGALVEAVPKKDEEKAKRALKSAKMIGAMGARAAARVILRSGAEEIIDALSEEAIDALGDFDALDSIVNEFGNGMSKAAGQLIAAQMAAEKVRKVELPEQLQSLHAALVQGAQESRVVVVIDELDRCHPDYALAFLEALKLIFSQSGFVFCLMVNADYLERLAKHRFGVSTKDEKYLDKFVDIRLVLSPQVEAFKQAIYELALGLPIEVPYGDTEEFSIEHAARLASTLAVETGLSMRKAKRLLLKVEVALRCYSDRPLDVSLLIYLAFKQEAGEVVTLDALPRAFLTPQDAEKRLYVPESDRFASFKNEDRRDHELTRHIRDTAPELLKLPRERFKLPDNRDYKEWAMVFHYLAPHYIPSHEAVLNAVASVLVPEQ